LQPTQRRPSAQKEFGSAASGSQSQPGGRGDLHWQSTHLSPAGHKLSGLSAVGSQSQPCWRQRHWTQVSEAEQVESSGDASGSQLHPGGRGVLHWQSTHMSPMGHKLSGFSAVGSQSQPCSRHLQPTQVWEAEHVESSGEASGSQLQPGGKTGAHPALVSAEGGFATHTFCMTQNCPVAGSCSAVDRSIVISAKTTLTQAAKKTSWEDITGS